MEKVILVQPENTINEAAYVPLGLISLAAYIRDYFEVRIMDLRYDSLDYFYHLIEELKPMTIGFSILTGSCIRQIVTISKEIKRNHPNVKIVVGGIHATFFPKQTLINPYIDFVVINEGEEVLLNLLRAIDKDSEFSDISNLGWKDKDGGVNINKNHKDFINMNALPMPAWDLIDVNRYIKSLSKNENEKVINIYTSKGCPFPCSFCYNLYFNDKKWRSKRAEIAVDEIEFLYNRYGINYFIVHDDNFVVDKERSLRIAELIIKKGLRIKYSIDMRIDSFEYDFLKQLKESGMNELRVGCESGSNRVLKEVLSKNITTQKIIRAVEIAKKLDINLILSFVIGWPTETIEERQDTIDLIIKLQKSYHKAAIYPLWIYIPYPGTKLFNKAMEMGFKKPDTLEEWGNYYWGKAQIPWLANQGEYEIIHELSPFAWYNKTQSRLTDKSIKNILRHILIKIFRPPVLFRFKHNFWRFPIDAKLIIVLMRLYQQSIKN